MSSHRNRPRFGPVYLSRGSHKPKAVVMPELRTSFHIIVGGLALVALSPDRAAAQPQDGDDWQVIVGAGVLVMPDYEGSDDLRVMPFPILALDYKNIVSIRGPQVQLSIADVKIAGDVRLRFGPSARYRQGRDEDDNSDLLGLGDVDGSVEVGGFARVDANRWWLQLSGGKDVIDGHDGVVAEIEAGVRFDQSDALSAQVRGTASWADSKYMRSNFGIDAAQAAASGLSRFSPDAGPKDVGAAIGLNYRLGSRWSIGGDAGYRRLLGDAADSPIVSKRGSANQLQGLLYLSYRL
jgi:outer membrane protein